MLIDKKDIEKAKEKLGDENAFIIADLLELDNFDEKNLKACCPYHSENTPSFIYNKKGHFYHCFAGETKVITKNGLKRIDELIGKETYIINGRGEWEKTKFVDCGKQELSKITLTKNLRTKIIYATPEHEWIVNNRVNKVKTKDLKKNQSLKSMWYRNTEKLKPLVDGMIHGFIYGDGHKAYVNKFGETVYNVAAHVDYKLHFMQKIFDELTYPKNDNYCMAHTHISSKIDLKEVPDYDSDKNYLFGFLAGYFVADGNCSDETVIFSSSNYEDLLKIQHICTLVGMPSYHIGETTRTPKSNMGIVPLTEDHTMYTLRLVKGLIPDVFFQSEKKLKTENKFPNSYMRYKVKNVEKTDRMERVYCCETSTHSFVLEDFILTGNCFGCNRTVDIIDVLMENGSTFLEAAEYLFEKAGMNYSFGEKNVKTKKNYRYPHEESLNERENVISYWGKRGISKNVLDYLDVREDAHGNGVFNFYDTNDVLTMVKYRPARTIEKGSGPKTWCQKDSDTAPLLFNMNRVNTSKALLITEGETDCASAIEAGYLNSVSVPLGAGNLHWIEENWDWLNGFDSIIIWSDNDEAGVKMRKDCIYRLGTWRTKYIATPDYFEKEDGKRIPLKDINDCLQIGGKEFVMDLISNAKDVPVKSVVDYSEIEELDISQMDGVATGIKPLDDELLKLFYGTLTVLSGRPASGKTSIIDQTIARTIDGGNPVFLFSKEMPERMSANWFNTIIAGRRNMVEKTSRDGRSYYIVPYEVQKQMQAYYSKKLFIYRDDEPNDVDSVLTSAEECVRKFGCKLIVLDNLMMIDLNCSESDKNTAQTNLINRLIKFAAKFNVAVVLIAHPRKTQDSNSDIEMYDISGTSNIINLAMRSIGLRRVSKKEKEDPKAKWGKYDVVLTVIKDRLLGKTDFQMGLWYDLMSRRFYTDYEEYDAKFAWDQKFYTDKLPYVERGQTEQFPDR